MKHAGILVFGTALGLVGGCVQVEPPGVEDLPVRPPAEWTGPVGPGGVETGWIGTFRDNRLPGLVEEALAGNLPLRAAMARLDQARALARIEGADRWPELSVSGNAGRQAGNSTLSGTRVRTHSNRFDLGAMVSWELDVWGRVRAQTLAAGSDALAAEADFESLRLSLAASVARAWFSAIEARRQEQLALETVESFKANLTTLEERFQRGLSPALDLRLSRANVAGAQSTYALQKRLADTAVRQLEALLGRYPSASLEVAEALPELEGGIPAGLPAELLERRPDIRAAAQRLMAADARLAESRRSLLPAIRLTGSYGRASSELGDLLEQDFDVWSILGNIAAPVFQGGRLRANVDRSEAVLAEAAANYGNVVLTAFREVESALAAEAYLSAQLEAANAAAEESTGARELAEERYERGLVDIITVLESQRRAFNSLSARIAVRNQLLQNRLILFLALGGGPVF